MRWSPLRWLPLALLALMAHTAAAQLAPFSEEERLQGYALRGDTTVFVFDPARYGNLTPERVVVTGAFRGWSADMNEARWQLAPLSAQPVWALPVPNKGYGTIAPAATFKFRVDTGAWLDPAAGAPNVAGGNLVFLFGTEPPRLQAELRKPRSIWMKVSGVPASLDVRAYRLTDARGTEIPLAQVLPNTATELLLVPAQDLDLRRVYWVEYLHEKAPGGKIRAWANFDGWFRELVSDKPLGAEIAADGSRTDIRLFAPRADRVTLFLYRDADGAAYREVEMARDAQGVWEASEPGDLHGVYYDFAVYGPDDPGNFFYNTTGIKITDPYARVSLDSWGRARIWRATRPATPLRNGRPKMEDVVSYQLHIEDFTYNLPVADDLKGTIPAVTIPGLRNRRGEPVGFDHILNLGVNVVHLQPMQEFLHERPESWLPAFQNDPFMREMGVNERSYEWGYRTTHYFAIESGFRQKGTEHGAEREQLRNLIQAFHDRGIAVIVDLVFNHTGENMEGRNTIFNFNGIDRPYYYRVMPDRSGTFEHIGVFGNEVKSENRPMVQRWIIDQCRMLIDEFGFDGFRIDLAGQTDEQTLRALREAVGPDIIIYGEPWIGSNDPDYEANPDWDWYKIDAPITFFQDDARNAFKGPVSTPRNPATDRGFAGGDGAMRDRTMRGLTNQWPDETTPNMGINYLDIHDNWALSDQFALHTDGPNAWDGRFGIDEGAYKIAATLLFTSLGPIVLHGGTEFIRSKGLAPHPDALGPTGQRILQHRDGLVYFKSRGDTYNTRAPNRFVWEDVGARKNPRRGVYNDYAGMLAYWKGLIAFRTSPAGAVFRKGEHVPDGYYRFLTPENPQLLGYVVDDQVLVLINTSRQPATFSEVALPAGSWRLIANGQRVDAQRGVGPALVGGRTVALSVPAQTAMVWVRP